MGAGWKFTETTLGQSGFEATVLYGRNDELALGVILSGYDDEGRPTTTLASMWSALSVDEARKLGQDLLDAADLAEKTRAKPKRAPQNRTRYNKTRAILAGKEPR
jgi:hypothetical protein